MYCVIIAGGSISDYSMLRAECDRADKVICADSGIRHAKCINIIPDVWVGDFDSTDGGEYLAGEKVTLPTEKDDTDTMYAARLAVYFGASEVTILGGIGTRLDHTMANLCVLAFLDSQAVKAKLRDENNTVFMLRGGVTATVYREEGAYLSLIPFEGTAHGVSIRGAKYPLNNQELYNNLTVGISNEIYGSKAEISVKKGMLAVFVSRD